MERTLIAQLPQFNGKQVRLRGWINNIRALGKLNFLLLRDRTGLAQIVVENKEDFKKIAHLQPGSVVTVTGKVIPTAADPKRMEIVEPQIAIESAVTDPLPIEYYKPEIPSDL